MKVITSISEFSQVDATAESGEYVAFLDNRARLEGDRAIRQLALDLLDARVGDRVLDVGCGSGNAIPQIAQRVRQGGKVVGLDFSQTMIDEARRRHGHNSIVEFVRGDVFGMSFQTDSFDRVRADRMFSHLKNPAKALDEMIRVLKPGGRALVCDMDIDTLYLDSRLPAMTQKFQSLASKLMRNGQVGRALPRLFAEAGLVNVECIPRVVGIDWTFADQLMSDLRHKPLLSFLLQRGKFDEWWQDQARAQARGHFHAGITVFTIVGCKPS